MPTADEITGDLLAVQKPIVRAVVDEFERLLSEAREDLTAERGRADAAEQQYIDHMASEHEAPPNPDFEVVYINDFTAPLSVDEWAVIHGSKQFANQGVRLRGNVVAGVDASGGFLDVHTRPVMTPVSVGGVTLQPGDYAAGMVQLREPYQLEYGAYEFDVEVSKSNGTRAVALLWPASDEWIEGEVDFLEIAGNVPDRDHNLVALWWSKDGQMVRPPFQLRVESDYTQQHRLRLEWRPGRLTLIQDGVIVWDHTSNVPSTPFKLGFQTAVGSGGRGTATTTPGKIRIRNLTVSKFVDPVLRTWSR